MENQYADPYQEFFSGLKKDVKTNPEKLALAYANYFWSGGRRGYVMNLPGRDKLYNFSILSKDKSLTSVTKRVSLISDTIVFSHDDKSQYQFYEFKDTPPKPGAPQRDQYCYLRCPNLVELGNWLLECKPLLLSGDLFYFPNIFVREVVTNYDYNEYQDYESEEETLTQGMFDFVIKNRKLVDLQTGNFAKSKLIFPVLALDIPYIDSVSLADFCKISFDEQYISSNFKDLLRKRFFDLQISQSNDSDGFEIDLAKLEIELREGIREVNSNYELLKRKRAFQAAGAAIATTTAVLLAINSGLFDEFSKIVGFGGGISGLFYALEQHILDSKKLKNEPYYYLWLLSKSR